MTNKYRCMLCHRESYSSRDDVDGLCIWCRIAARDHAKADHVNAMYDRLMED